MWTFLLYCAQAPFWTVFPFLGNICTSKGCQEPGWERQPWWCEVQNPQMRNGSGYWAEVLMVFLQIIKGLPHEKEEYILSGCPIQNKGQLVNLPGSHISNQPGEKLQAIRNVWFWNGWPDEMSFLPLADTLSGKAPIGEVFLGGLQIKAITPDFYGAFLLWNSNIFKWGRN